MNRLHAIRKLTQISFMVLIFLMPVFDIFRYDTATKELFVLGNVWTLGLKEGFQSSGDAAHVAVQFFLKAILPWVVVLAFFPLMGVFLGRFFCGWFCPEGALFELADFLSLKTIGRRSLYKTKHNDPDVKKSMFFYRILSILFLITIPPVTAIALTGYFIAPKTIWNQITTGNLSFGVKAGIIGVSIYMIITSVFVRHVFCKYVCAAGLMQMLFGWASPLSLRIRFDRDNLAKCTDCKGCEKVCFMDVKPRHPKRDINCVNCGECITACKKELGEDGLFGYSFGNKKDRV